MLSVLSIKALKHEKKVNICPWAEDLACVCFPAKNDGKYYSAY